MTRAPKSIQGGLASISKDLTEMADWMRKVDAAAKAVLEGAPEHRAAAKDLLTKEEIRLQHLTRWFLKKEGFL